jgi:predicted NAD/FAD-binding protein
MRVAVIGAGISGLAAAFYLSRKHDVWLIEKDGRIGGHTNTVSVETERGPLAIDTGFIVHNDRTYPNLVKLFDELGVEPMASDMSFAVACQQTGFEYSSRGFAGFFAQKTNLLRREHYRLLGEIVRFNREAPRWLDRTESLTLGEVMDEGRYAPVFTERYLYPMACAVWSMSTDAIRSFPASTLLRFFDNHGMLGIATHPQWKVLKGGSATYLPLISKPFRDRILTRTTIDRVTRSADGVTIAFRGRPAMDFDQVVFACHGNQILPLLEAPTDDERDVLGSFETSCNEVCLHTDGRVLARRPRARASWNYHLEREATAATLTYHMNRLQSLNVAEDYCVTMNGNSGIDPSKVIQRFIYHHPLYTRRAVAAQSRWASISGQNRTHYCGAYWLYGFHEDGLNSAMRVARALGVAC